MNRVAGFGKDPEHSLEYMDLSPIYLDLDVASSRLKSLGETPVVVAVDDPFEPASYDSLLRIDVDAARASFPELDFD